MLDLAEACPRLSRLDLSKNQLPSLEGVSGCRALRWLSVAGNAVGSLEPLRELEALEVGRAALGSGGDNAQSGRFCAHVLVQKGGAVGGELESRGERGHPGWPPCSDSTWAGASAAKARVLGSGRQAGPVLTQS